MTTQISHFYFEHQISIRTIIIDDEPWFIAKDVCTALDIANSRDALSKLDDDEKGVGLTDTLSGRQKMAIINESGLYTLILRCRDAVKPGTVPHRFRKWITNEVLPTIRKTGRYERPVCTPQRTTSEPLSPNDMNNLSHLVTLMSIQFRRDTSWRRAVWFALRRVTGTASPEQYTVNDLPALAEECRRLFQVTSATNEMIVRIEKEAIRRIVRNGEECERVLVQLQREAEGIDFEPGAQTLERFERLAVERMERRLVS